MSNLNWLTKIKKLFLFDSGRNSFFVAGILALLGFALYSNTLNGGFCSDDYNIILNNTAIEDIKDIGFIWRSFNTRFLVGLSFALNYGLSGYKVFGYHLFNIFSHILASVCVYYFVRLTFQTPVFKISSYTPKASLIAFFSSLIFLAHPLQTQGVAYITQRAVSMGTIFYLTTLIFYIQSRLSGKITLRAAAFFTMLLGMMTKEFMITVPLMLAVYEFYFFEPGKSFEKFKRVAPFFAGIFCIFLIFFLDRRDSILHLRGQIEGASFSRHYFLTEINVMRTYLRLLVLPIHQHHDYKYPVVESFFEGPLLFSAALLAGLIFFAVKMFPKRRLLSFGIAWFFVSILVEVIHPCFVKKGLIYEHWLYLAMTGFSLFVSFALFSVLDKTAARRILIGIIAVFCVMTYSRNKVWQSEIALWEDNIQKSPQNATGYFALGAAYGRLNDFVNEMLLYEKTIGLDPNYYEAYNNLAVVYLKLGELEKVIEYCQKALYLKPDYPESLATLGAVYFLKKEYGKASAYLQKAIDLYEQEGIFYKARHARNILKRISRD